LTITEDKIIPTTPKL